MHKPLKLILLTLSPVLLACNKSVVNEHPKPKPTPTPTQEVTPSEDPLTKSYKVLFIGNSFTHYNDLEKVSEEIGKSMGLDITCDRVAISAYKLSQYATDGNPGNTQVKEKINNNEYTHIILQEHSTTPAGNYEQFLTGATNLVQLLKEKQSNASIRLYETWGYEAMVGSYGSTIAECEDALCKGYQSVGQQLELPIHYVGKAFTKWVHDYPTVSPYYSGDNKHPSFLGTYLAGLMHVLAITNASIDNVTYQGTQGEMNAYGETYINDTNKANAISVVKAIYKQYGTRYQ